MSTSCKILMDGTSFHAEPVGALKKGWLPGTWVTFSPLKPTFYNNAIATIDVCDEIKWPSGFISIGSMRLLGGFDCKYPNDNELRGEWSPDEMLNYKTEQNAIQVVDSDKMLGMLGSGIVSLSLHPTGVFKFYVYEKYNRAYRDSNGVLGGILDWTVTPGKFPVLYISNRGLLTCENESGSTNCLQYTVAAIDEDEVGMFVIIAGCS